MKKYVLAFTCIMLGWNALQAQCTPDPNASGLISPNPAQANYQLVQGQSFSETFTINVPTDTSVSIGPVSLSGDVDSVVLSGVAGLPPGMTYECNPVSCVWLGGTQGCIRIFGIPTQVGTFDVTISSNAYIQPAVGPQQTYAVPADPLEIVVVADTSNSTGIASLQAGQIKVTNYPNPFRNETRVLFETSKIEQIEIKVYNMIGEMVYIERFMTSVGTNEKRLNMQLAPGQYFYTLTSASLSASSRMIVLE